MCILLWVSQPLLLQRKVSSCLPARMHSPGIMDNNLEKLLEENRSNPEFLRQVIHAFIDEPFASIVTSTLCRARITRSAASCFASGITSHMPLIFSIFEQTRRNRQRASRLQPRLQKRRHLRCLPHLSMRRKNSLQQRIRMRLWRTRRPRFAHLGVTSPRKNACVRHKNLNGQIEEHPWRDRIDATLDVEDPAAAAEATHANDTTVTTHSRISADDCMSQHALSVAQKVKARALSGPCLSPDREYG